MKKYLTGEATQPVINDPKYETWYQENSMVMSWLINSMSFGISEEYLLTKIAKEIWDSSRDTYSAIEHIATLLQLKGKLL